MMGTEDDKSEICRFATKLVDIAELYEKAATAVEDEKTSSWLRRRAECRRHMMSALLARAGLAGGAAGSALPGPEALWFKANSLISSTDDAVIRPVRSAERALLQTVVDYLSYSDASGPPALAARWLRDVLEPDVGQVQDKSASKDQPG